MTVSELQVELQKYGLLEWSTKKNYFGGIDGIFELATFEAAYNVLSGCLPIKGVNLNHSWYKDWSWIESDSYNNTTFTAMNNTLIDDCIREIAGYLDYLHLIHLSRIDGHFKAIAAETFAKCHIDPSTVGTIDFMNLRYLLDMFGGSMIELSVSLHAFRSTFGAYPDDTKTCILRVIFYCTNPLKLKKIYLYGFDLSKTDKDCFVKAFSEQGTQLIEIANINENDAKLDFFQSPSMRASLEKLSFSMKNNNNHASSNYFL